MGKKSDSFFDKALAAFGRGDKEAGEAELKKAVDAKLEEDLEADN